MPRLYPLILALLFLLPALACPAWAGDDCVQVDIKGSVLVPGIHIQPPGEISHTVCRAKASYDIRLIFPAAGGEPLAQSSVVKVEDLRCGQNERLLPCLALVKPADFRMMPFTLWGRLEADRAPVHEGWAEPKPEPNQVQIRLRQMPARRKVTLHLQCGRNEDHIDDDGKLFFSIMLPLKGRNWTFVSTGDGNAYLKDQFASVSANLLAELEFNQRRSPVACPQ